MLIISLDTFAQFDPKQRRQGTDSEWIVKFFRVNNPNEYLYEDANSSYSKNKGMNYLGIEGKGDNENNAMIVKYTRGKVMPQYLIMLGKSVKEGTEFLCPHCQDPECEHSKVEVGFTSARFLVSLKDSLDYYEGNKEKFDLFTHNDYTRLAFVDGKLYGDSVVVIQNSAKLGKDNRLNVRDVDESGEGAYSPVLFSFRLLVSNDDIEDFMIESWGKSIASRSGHWVKIHNGVPVITETTIDSPSANQAEIFNIEYTTEDPVANTGVSKDLISVSSDYGTVTIHGASGRKVTISNTLGQTVANQLLTSDATTIAVPSGVVVVAVEGRPAAKILVK